MLLHHCVLLDHLGVSRGRREHSRTRRRGRHDWRLDMVTRLLDYRGESVSQYWVTGHVTFWSMNMSPLQWAHG